MLVAYVAQRRRNVDTGFLYLQDESFRLFKVCICTGYQNYTLRPEVNHPPSNSSTQTSQTTCNHVAFMAVEDTIQDESLVRPTDLVLTLDV